MRPSDEHAVPMRRWTGVLLLVDGGLGFAIGAFLLPAMQIAVEPAHALAGLVQYPFWNPQYQYEIRTWTLLNQLPALALNAGMSELTVSILISGLAGSLSFAAIALLIYAVVPSRPGLAMLAPFAVVFAKGPSFPGVTYMVKLIGSEATYGMIGLSFVMLVVALLACGEYRWAGVGAVVAPAVHPSLGVWLGCAVLIALAFQLETFQRALREHWRFWTAGALVSGASFFAHRLTVPPAIVDARGAEYFSAFIRLWDTHRRPFPIATVAVAEVACAFVAALFVWRLAGRSASEGQKTLAILVLATVIMGAAGSVTYWMPPERVPALLLALMPSRLLNVALFAAAPLLIGLLASYRATGDRDLTLFLLGTTASAAAFRAIWFFEQRTAIDELVPGWRAATHERVLLILQVTALGAIVWRAVPLRRREGVLWAGAAAALCIAGVLLLGRSVDPAVAGRYSVARFLAVIAAIAAALVAGLVARRSQIPSSRELRPGRLLYRRLTNSIVVVSALLFIANTAAYPRAPLVDRTNDPFWRTVASRRGMIVAGPGIGMVQLRSRRPVLLATESLDYLPFTEGVGSAMELILREVYGIDLLAPPDHLRRKRSGGLPRGQNRALFEGRSAAQWTALRRRFGFTDLLCEQDWEVNLPRVASGHGLALYSVPE